MDNLIEEASHAIVTGITRLLLPSACGFFLAFAMATNSCEVLATEIDGYHSFEGAWTGTVAQQDVVVNISGEDSGYYYLRYLKRIILVKDPAKPGQLFEGGKEKPSAIWALMPVVGDTLEGRWSDASSGRAYAIHLTRLQAATSDVSSDTLRHPAVFGQKVSTGEIREISGRRYRQLTAMDGYIKGIELLESGLHIAKLNILLKNDVHIGIDDYLGCYDDLKKRGRLVGGSDFFTSKVEPVFWNDEWITLAESREGYCGGAYPFSSTSHKTFSLTTGKQVNLWTWIKNSKKENSYPEFDSSDINYAPPDGLKRLVINRIVKQSEVKKEVNGCVDEIGVDNSFELVLGKSGLIFFYYFPHVAQVCDGSIEIPYKTLMPYLSREGKAAVKLLMQTQ